ncbi:hypothetical protein [Marinicrinis sediminis]|uniref:Uncharacterized protein n=1 Tax=Marinicrinis sediminis TaxID=1652465 RepID=A0ABW5RD74_9BACL
MKRKPPGPNRKGKWIVLLILLLCSLTFVLLWMFIQLMNQPMIEM